MLLRIIVAADDIRRLDLMNVPATVDELQNVLARELGIQGAFIIQYQDPEFGFELCNLTNISLLPPEKATLQLIFRNASIPAEDLSDDPANAPAGDSASSVSSRSGSWPAEFITPTFRHDIALKLEAADRKFEEDGSLMVVTKDIKADVLEKLASKIYSYSAYPTCSQLKAVGQALVERHPCLKEPGSAHGYYGWTISLKFKMGNFRQRLRIAGCPELSVNSDKSTQDMGGKKRKLKKPRRSETNFLPVPPTGMTASSQEKERDFIQSEVKKRHPDWALINNAMTATFSLRRKEIVEEEPQVSHIKTRWPALFTETQIALEFTRLVSIDLKRAFFDGLDRHMTRLLELYADRKAEADRKLRQLMQSLLRNESNQCRREAALQGLPYFLREDPGDFLKICEPTVPEDELTRGITVGIVVVTEKVEEVFLQPEDVIDVAVILEEDIVLQGLHDIPNAVATVMGLLYVLNIDYPKAMKYTFEMIQRVFMGIGSEACSAKVHGLKNKLLQ